MLGFKKFFKNLFSKKEAGTIPKKVTSPRDDKDHLVVVKPGSNPRKFLHVYSAPAQEEKEKWTSDEHWADRFISDTTAHNVAKRKLGHSNYELQKLRK